MERDGAEAVTAGGVGDANLERARELVDALARHGVREACVAPGSRSTPLVLALAGQEAIRARVVLDERSAAFFALGVGKASGRPAAVVTTSGTATANLHPAVLEAHRSGTPLLALTADRPHHLRGTDANQTADQVGLYGDAVRLFHEVAPTGAAGQGTGYLRGVAARAVSAAVGRPPGPVHLNLPFARPLQPEGGPGEGDGVRAAGGPPVRTPTVRSRPDRATLARLSGQISGAGRGLIVAGPDPEPDRLGPAALALARESGWPLAADPLSGARFRDGAADAAQGAFDLFLRSGAVRERLRPDWVLRLGGRPTSKLLRRWLGRLEEARVVVVHDLPAWPDPGAGADEVLRADPASTAEALTGRLAGAGAGAASGWLEAWRAAEAASVRAARDGLDGPLQEAAVLEAAARVVPAGGLLFAGSSMPVRELDAFGAPRDAPLRVVGNRGVSGIDGSTSTALGAAVAHQGPAVAVVGDLALLHDVNGLMVAAREGIPLVVVVLQNDGGGIFHYLPVREHEPHFTPYFATPHGVDLSRAAALYGVSHRVLEVGGSPGSRLGAALEEALEAGEPAVLEVRTDREDNRRRREEVTEEAAAAAARALSG